MPQRNILILDKEEAPWRSFLEEFFNDTPSRPQSFEDAAKASQYLSKKNPDVIFITDSLVNQTLAQKIKAYQQVAPQVRVFELGSVRKPSGLLRYDYSFQEPVDFQDFQKKLVRYLPFPEKLKLLVTDDEQEVGQMFTDYFRERVEKPAFDMEYHNNGQKGLAAIERFKPDVMVLDVKMPVMRGIEVYREARQKGYSMPVIFFFDAIFGDEVIEIHKIGNPAIVEKGSRGSHVQEMVPLILKMYYFA